MAVELVTGYSGTAHVSSSEDGARQAGTVGTGMYALMTVDEPLKSVLENANTVTVGAGDVLINGRHVQLTGSTTYAVPVGEQGMQTSNLLVIRYSVADDGTEKAEAVTLTGDPAASDPKDPELATGSILDGDSPVDMPLYRVITTGIETAQPVKLFETVPPYTELDIPMQLSELGGTLDASKIAGALAVAHGGTGSTSASAARTALGVPPTSHASSATTYGAGNASNYGHVKLTDSTGATNAASSGVAASPKMVRDFVSQPSTTAATGSRKGISARLLVHQGHVVSLMASGTTTASIASGEDVALLTIPAAYRPALQCSAMINKFNGGATTYLQAFPDGTAKLKNYDGSITSGNGLHGALTWQV